MPDAKVLTIPEGGILVLTGIEPSDALIASAIVTELRDRVGHERFAILVLPGGTDAQVWGPDDDIKARLDEVLAER